MMSHRGLYWTVIGLFAVLGVVMLVSWNYSTPNQEAQAKAQQLITAFDRAGLRTPADADEVARVFGDDGGAVCANLGDHQLGLLKTRLGVGGEFYFRPTKVDRRVVEGLVLVAQVYCPDKLATAREFVDSLSFSNVIRS